MRRIANCLLLAALLAGHSPAWAQDVIRTEAVRIPAGKTGTVIRGSIVGRGSVSYTVGAEAGQTMNVTLKPSNLFTYFNIYEPGRGPGDEALAVSEMTGPMVPDLNRFRGKLPTSGTYTISVYMIRAAARRNERSTYRLDVSISALGNAASRPPVKADFADGLQGGPDFWEVSGVQAGDALNMRRGPSTKEPVVTRFKNGDVLRNTGCRMADGQRWCAVERPEDPSVAGWVAGRFLREGSYAGASATPPGPTPAASIKGDALVAGTRFHATGEIPCARRAGQPMESCKFGVVRRGGGNGDVTIFWPDAGSRTITFEKGTPVRFDQSETGAGARLDVKRNADLNMLTIGDERFEIPDVVIFGG